MEFELFEIDKEIENNTSIIESRSIKRKSKIVDNTVSLQVRLRFADMRYLDVILKTVIPQ